MKRQIEFGFVEDGYERARSAIEPVIRNEVEQAYEARIASANPFERWRLTQQMEKEIADRVHKRAPPGALY